MEGKGKDSKGLKAALIFLKGFEATLKDPKFRAFVDAWHEEDKAKRPKRGRGRPKGVSKYDGLKDTVEQHPHLSDRELALMLDPQPHNQEALRKAIERARSAPRSAEPRREARAERRMEAIAKQTGLPEAFVSFLIDDDGWIRPARESLERLQAMIAETEAALGQ